MAAPPPNRVRSCESSISNAEKQQERRFRRPTLRRMCFPMKKGRDTVTPAFPAWLLQMPLVS
jgi:hypothetical protein